MFCQEKRIEILRAAASIHHQNDGWAVADPTQFASIVAEIEGSTRSYGMDLLATWVYGLK
jgi:hypothetical protein